MMNHTLKTVLFHLFLACSLVLPFLDPHVLQAQGTAATVSGFITDASGAKIPSASVTFTNVATGVAGRGQ